jgi:hypothetical protein
MKIRAAIVSFSALFGRPRSPYQRLQPRPEEDSAPSRDVQRSAPSP